LVWIAGCWNSSIFYSRAVIQKTIVDPPAFLKHVSEKKIPVCAHTTHVPNKYRRVIGILYEAAQNFEVFLNIQTKIKKSKTFSG
jgi:hypothetical protein